MAHQGSQPSALCPLGFLSPPACPEGDARACSKVQRHEEGPGQQCWVSPSPAQAPVPKKQDGFAIGVFSWLTQAAVGLQGLGVSLGYELPYLLFSAAGWHGSWLLPRATTCCGSFATRLRRVFRYLLLGPKQLLRVQLVAGVLF